MNNSISELIITDIVWLIVNGRSNTFYHYHFIIILAKELTISDYTHSAGLSYQINFARVIIWQYRVAQNSKIDLEFF